MGVASGCGCKEVYRFPHTILIPTPTPLVSVLFLQQHPYFSFIFLNVFRSLYIVGGWYGAGCPQFPHVWSPTTLCAPTARCNLLPRQRESRMAAAPISAHLICRDSSERDGTGVGVLSRSS